METIFETIGYPMHRSNSRNAPTRLSSLCAAILALCFVASPAQAYLGPGSGLTALGSVIALLGVIGLGILGFLWYPVKRLLKRLRGSQGQESPGTGDTE